MERIRMVMGYTMAAAALAVALATVLAGPYFEDKLVDSLPGMTVSPWATGGEVVATIDHDEYETAIHEPVFQGLLAERDKGFVQIDWVRKTALPSTLTEEVDFDRDGTVDFEVECDLQAGEAVLTPHNPNVLGEVEVFGRESGFSVRVWLQGPAD